MEKSEKDYIFVIQYEDGEIKVADKEEINRGINEYEESDVELDFTVIAKINSLGLTMDFNTDLIQWYKPAEVTEEISQQTAMAILNHLLRID